MLYYFRQVIHRPYNEAVFVLDKLGHLSLITLEVTGAPASGFIFDIAKFSVTPPLVSFQYVIWAIGSSPTSCSPGIYSVQAMITG